MKEKIVLALMVTALVCLVLSGDGNARIKIEITSSQGLMPIAISALDGPYGAEIANIVREDLAYTGLFNSISPDGFTEKPDEKFDLSRWTAIGAEAVLKGSVKLKDKDKIVISATLMDTSDGTALLNKEYEAGASLTRQLAHGLANDVYYRITGQKGVFRTKIAFVAWQKEGKSIYLMDWDGQRIRKTGITATAVFSPHWSSDGSTLAYSALRNGKWGIYVMDFNSSVEKTIYTTRGSLTVGDFFPSGKELAISSTSFGNPDIFRFKIATAELTKLTSSKGIEVSPSVSPDGLTIAFVSDRGGSPQIYLMGASGEAARRLTFDGAYNASPSWSPMADKIAFVGRHEGQNQIFVINPDGTGHKRLTASGVNEDPSFSPDGRFIVFSSSREGERGVYIMRADGEGQKRLTPKGIKAARPRWSPL